ncbi:TonB C-terminal domain-containing protein, partial [Corallococcus exiguus]|uniref:TonB C-terminal domain-containing protein n=1 Tax=Corallococcus exiguus TaxID=83462 RepID=UPI00149477A3
GPDGLLREVKLISRSGNRAYDDYVLQAVPPALGKSAAPPPDAGGTEGEVMISTSTAFSRSRAVRPADDSAGSTAHNSPKMRACSARDISPAHPRRRSTRMLGHFPESAPCLNT